MSNACHNVQVHGVCGPYRCKTGVSILIKESKTNEAVGRLSGISCNIGLTNCIISGESCPVA